MNKEQYLSKLKKLLPDYEAQEIINDFEEHFNTALAEGKTEEEIIKDLGDPIEIAKEYGYEEKSKAKASSGVRVFALIGLVLFDLMIGIPILASLFSAWMSLWSVVVSLIAAGIGMLVGIFLVSIPWYILVCGAIAVLAFAVLLGIGMIYVSKYAFKGLVWYGRLHIKAATGE